MDLTASTLALGGIWFAAFLFSTTLHEAAHALVAWRLGDPISRSRGLFAGVALKGSTLRSDDSDNKKLYGKEVRHEEILLGKVAPPAVAKPLLDTLTKYSTAEKK